MTVIVLAGCSQTQVQEVKDPGYQIFTAEDENFQVKTYINKLEFEENEEINIYSTIEYVGENNSISVWSGEPYFHHLIHNGEEYINDDTIETILKETVLKKGDIHTIPFSKSGGYSQDDPKAEFWKQYFSEKELKLPKGDYTFTAKTGFFLDMDQQESITLKTEFVVKVK